MMRVFFAIIMSGMGLGQSSSFAPDAAKVILPLIPPHFPPLSSPLFSSPLFTPFLPCFRLQQLPRRFMKSLTGSHLLIQIRKVVLNWIE
jgi:hypothetical protein